MAETGARVTQKLDSFLYAPQRLNQFNIEAWRSGILNLEDLDQLHRYLLLKHRQYPEITSILFATPAGDFLVSHRAAADDFEAGQTALQPTDPPFEAGRVLPQTPDQLKIYAIDQAGYLGRLIEIVQGFKVHQRPWYQWAVETGQPGWTDLFQIGSSNLLALNTYAPFYDDQQQLQGVFAANLSLNQIDNFLRNLQVKETGAVFIIERNGFILATSTAEPAYIASGYQPYNTRPSLPTSRPGEVDFQRVVAADSPNPLVRQATRQINEDFGSLEAIQEAQVLDVTIAGQRHFVEVMPYHHDLGLDWLLVTVVPQADFMAEITANVHHTIWLCTLALLISLGFGLLVVRWVTQPLEELGQAAQAYATQGKPMLLEATPIQELSTLKDVFENMTFQIESQKAELARTIKNEELENFFSASIDLLCITDSKGRFRRLNRQWEATLGYPLAELEKNPMINLVHPDDLDRTLAQANRLRAGQAVHNFVNRYRHQDGSYRWIEWRSVPVGSLFYSAARDITDHKLLEQELQDLNQQLQQLATTDSLTQVANRRSMDSHLQTEWQRCQREQTSLALILLDIDHFKAYNDHYGHLQGDVCLQQVAQLLQANIHRPGDLVARYGGEEFLLILPSIKPAGAIHVVEGIQTALTALALPHATSPVRNTISLSFGLAVITQLVTITPEQAITLADQALYRAKQIRNNYQICVV